MSVISSAEIVGENIIIGFSDGDSAVFSCDLLAEALRTIVPVDITAAQFNAARKFAKVEGISLDAFLEKAIQEKLDRRVETALVS